MKLTAINENGEVKTKFEATVDDERVGYDDILATLFCVMEASSEEVLKGLKTQDREMVALRLEELFSRCFYKIFPEMAPQEGEDFDLCDAAIIKAQDDIITEAEAKGITFREALAQYNDRAREYVNAKKMS